jgi:hypothetical protein
LPVTAQLCRIGRGDWQTVPLIAHAGPVDAPRTRFGLIFAVVVIVGTVGMWAYLFLIADPDVPDRLDDDTFATEGQAVCAEAVGRIDELPAADESPTPEDRAEVVEEANGILEEMVADLRRLAPTEGTDGRITDLWLDDWEVFLGDRDAYAAELATGNADAELLVSAREGGGGQITETIDHFAQINDMEDCTVPLDA